MVRKARMQDVPSLLALINAYAAEGAMLSRTAFEMSENIRDFTVICSGERTLGCAALHFYGSAAAEVRSLAVDPAFKSQGLGRILWKLWKKKLVISAWNCSLHSPMFRSSLRNSGS
jgi:N-acetylglutamate synthase-like GNAT family acetyltransferase